MKKIGIISILLFFMFSSCYSQETDNNNRFYVQIEDFRFYPRFSHRDDVEAFLGAPSSVRLDEGMYDGFHWSNITIALYWDDALIFTYNDEGNIIQITVSADYSGNVFIFGRQLRELNHTAVTYLLEQPDIRIILTREDVIATVKPDFEGDYKWIMFFFDDKSNITTFITYYENPW